MRGEVIAAGDFSLSFELGFDDDNYRFGVLKIAYELACIVLGTSYVDDPIAARVRSLLTEESPSPEIAAARLTGQVGGLFGPGLRPIRPEREPWLIGLVYPQEGKVLAYVRLFDRFDGWFIMSDDSGPYTLSPGGRGWIIDVRTGHLRATDFTEIQQE